MKLFMFPVAPNPTKVRAYLAEKRALGCEIDVEEVQVNLPGGETKEDSFLARNPFGTVPVLETESGSNLFESLAIIDYLEELHPNPPIWGNDPEARAMARQLERIADLSVLISIARIVHATDSPIGLPPNPAVAEDARPHLTSRLDFFEDRLSDGRPFVLGERPSVVDCTIAAGLQFGRFRQLDFTENYPALRKWDEAYRARDVMAGVFNL